MCSVENYTEHYRLPRSFNDYKTYKTKKLYFEAYFCIGCKSNATNSSTANSSTSKSSTTKSNLNHN